MSNRRKDTHRFPRGEHCDQCRSRKWYAESGFRFCENGHRIEGFIEVDIDEDDNFGQRGRVSRKQRELREKATRHLSGTEARELYLECLQLVLRHQIWWLVNDRRLPSELETVVRDLWDLRIRNFAGLKKVAAAEESDANMDSGTDGELFSSQAGSESDASTATTRTAASRARSWTSEPGQEWNLPGLLHCLALCYLGCLSLNLPVRIGQIYGWAKNDQLPFLEAIDILPHDMVSRLPGSYHRALTVKHTSFRGGELHQEILELVLEYHLNFGMAFPPINTPLLIFHYLRELALPAEVYVHVRAMSRVLGFDFTLGINKQRYKLLDHPDILLVASVVFATKLLYPFDEKSRRPFNYRDPSSLQVNWSKWRELMRDLDGNTLERRDINKLEVEDVWTLSDEKIDDYLNWYEETRIKPKTETQELRELFPLSIQPRKPSSLSLTDDQIDERLQAAQGYIESVTPAAGGWILRAGDDHAVYRSSEDLPEAAQAFYGKAAELSGLSLGRLVRAVDTLERLVSRWCSHDKFERQKLPQNSQCEQDTS
ncbi:hypothetical protein BD289DRAFT_422602 [Coniella lustricola]|uniref:RRN7-type domain-containing protein n=1 Tax=Coniella lustricola TaxID=2025994 RepID=A0A2T3AKC3_9PEZI|nr:hypothetical protein BD289DRAFT_422602 [Coniella lustricola]